MFLLPGYIIVITGRQGAGKTLINTILGQYFSLMFSCPLYANYNLANSTYLTSLVEMKKIFNSVICLTETQQTADSRDFRNNIEFTNIIAQTRKHRNIILIDTQTFDRIDKRIRDDVTYRIECTRNKFRHIYVFYEPGYYETGKIIKFSEENLRPFFDLYDSYQTIEQGLTKN